MKTPKIHCGNLVAKAGVAYDFAEITGKLDCSKADKKTTFDKLTTIGGGAYFRGWTGSANNLTTIGGYADFQGWTGSADKLTTIGGSAYFRGWTGLADKLTTIGESADFQGWTGSADKLTTIGESAYFQGWTGSADNLTIIGESADFQGWTGSADKLTTIGGGAYFRGWTGSADNLTTIGGYAYFRGWTGSADKLTTIGGSADFQGWTGSADKIKLNAGQIAKTICSDSQKAAFAALGLVLVDGILSKVISKRGSVMRVVIIGKAKQLYIVERDGKTAHGATLAEARADLLVKIGNRDTTPYRTWTTKTKVSLEDMIVAYRTITGACGQGCSHFLADKNYPAKVSVELIIGETVGKYGHESFKAFFNK